MSLSAAVGPGTALAKGRFPALPTARRTPGPRRHHVLVARPMAIVEALFQGVMNLFEVPFMKILIFAACLFAASHAFAQAPDPAAGD